MPLPDNGTPWPPHEGSREYDELRENSAWYSGERRQLETYYAARTGAGSGPVARPAQHAGGVVGAMARWWWGTPAASGEADSKLHVPLAADIATTSADLLFSEQIDIRPGGAGGDKVSKYLADLQGDGLDSRLNEGAEVCSALGSAYLRVTWDTTLRPRPWTQVIHPDGALPEFRGGILVAINLWTQLASLGTSKKAGPMQPAEVVVYRHIERHESGAIIHALYQGTRSNLGQQVPLQDHPATEALALVVNDQGAQETNTKRLTVSHIPNMLPDRRNRHSVVGRSDFQGVTPLFDALDEAYSSWLRDIRLAKTRIHVPASMLDSDGVGKGATVNLDRELYVPLQGVLASASASLADSIDVQQFVIRVAEHSQTCKEWREAAIESAGYSVGGDGSGDGDKTATEVRADNRRSYMTRGKKARYWTAGLRDHLSALLEVANANLSAGLGADVEVDVEFPDGVQESAMEMAQTAQALKTAGAASTETLVKMVHPEWDGKQVSDETARVLAESAIPPAPDPLDVGL